jgi:uncharacterized protein (TIGR02596 family)
MERKITTTADAYTLIELLLVVAIAGMLFALILPALSGIRSASNMGMAVETVYGALTNARQLATTKDRDVEFRLIEMKAPGTVYSDRRIRAVQILEVLENGSYQPGKVRMLPSGIVISSSSSWSSLSLLPDATPTNADPALPHVSRDYQYRSFRFRRDGTLNLKSLLPSADTYQLTIYDEKFDSTASAMPANYATIQLEPATGAAVLYRP